MPETCEYQIIFWREIPVQVRVRGGAERHSRPLPARFQQAMTRSAYRARTITGDDYMASWIGGRWQPYAAGAEQALAEIIAGLEASYPQARLDRLIEGKGYSEDITHDS